MWFYDCGISNRLLSRSQQKQQKVTLLASPYMSVHPFSFNSSRNDDWTFIKFDSGEFHQSVSMTAIVG